MAEWGWDYIYHYRLTVDIIDLFLEEIFGRREGQTFHTQVNLVYISSKDLSE